MMSKLKFKAYLIPLLYGLILHTGFTQPKLELEISTNDPVDREILKLKNLDNSLSNSVRMTLESGDAMIGDQGTLLLSAHGLEYTASPGYAGAGVITNGQSGLILRSSGSLGKMNFLTGGSNTLTNSRLLITDVGNIGINTTTPLTKMHLKNGKLYIDDTVSSSGSEIIMKSPNGTCYAIRVSNTGVLSATSLVSCPNSAN